MKISLAHVSSENQRTVGLFADFSLRVATMPIFTDGPVAVCHNISYEAEEVSFTTLISFLPVLDISSLHCYYQVALCINLLGNLLGKFLTKLNGVDETEVFSYYTSSCSIISIKITVKLDCKTCYNYFADS